MGSLSVGKDGEAHFFSGEGEQNSTVLAEMTRAKLEHVSAKGMKLSGMQPDGNTRAGQRKFLYQEWWLRYCAG